MSSSLKLIISFVLLCICLIGSQASDDYLPDRSTGGGGDICGGFSDRDNCPINCFRADLVCGENGVTYSCGCPEAACNGVRVVKRGACDAAGNVGSASVPGQALLLIHIVWLFLLGLSLLFGGL
ncbi:unnamed protein product [Cochlearia groenlandica]